MHPIFHPILNWIAGATQQELAKYVEFLKAENAMLCSRLGKHVVLQKAERNWLLTLGRACGTAIKGLITVVTCRTFCRWVQAAAEPTSNNPLNPVGRPRVSIVLRDLVIKLASENAWGLNRILGELRKLRVRKICRGTVRNILLEANLEPGPERGRGS